MKSVLEKFSDIWLTQMPEEEESSIIEVDWFEISGELNDLIAEEEQVKNNSSISDVSGISTDLEKDIFVLINKYAKAGLSKPHTVARLEWVLGSVKKS